MGPIRVCRKTFKGWGVDLITGLSRIYERTQVSLVKNVS